MREDRILQITLPCSHRLVYTLLVLYVVIKSQRCHYPAHERKFDSNIISMRCASIFAFFLIPIPKAHIIAQWIFLIRKAQLPGKLSWIYVNERKILYYNNMNMFFFLYLRTLWKSRVIKTTRLISTSIWKQSSFT